MESDDSEHVFYIHAAKFKEATRNLSDDQVGRLILDMMEMRKAGRLGNGDIVRSDKPTEDEGSVFYG